MKRFIALILVLLLITGCSKEASISGTWERQGTDFSGMRVVVEELDDNTFRGTIAKSDNKGMYTKGNVKWYEIKKIKDNAYDFTDVGPDGITYSMSMRQSDGKTLLLRNLIDTGEVGAEQTWKLVN